MGSLRKHLNPSALAEVTLINSYLLTESEVFRENIKPGPCRIDHSNVNSKAEV